MQEIGKNINSLATSVALITPAYMLLMEALLGMTRNNTLVIMAVIIMACVIVAWIFSRKILLNYTSFGIILLFCLLYLISIPNFQRIGYSFVQFGFYVLLPSFLMSQELNYERILRYIIIFSFPLILALDDLMGITNVGLKQADMYVVYAIVPFIVAALSHMIHYRKDSSYLIKLGYIINLYYAIRVSINAVRGFLIVIIVFLAIEIICKLKLNNSKLKYRLIFVAAFLGSLLIALNFNVCLVAFLHLLQKYVGEDWSFITKTLILLQRGDLSNGRLKIWEDAIRCFADSPIWGHGIDGFQLWNNYGTYPHNFILQLLTDGGILFSIAPIIVVIKGMAAILGTRYQERKRLFFGLYLVSIGMTPSLLSGDMWKSCALWMTVFFFCKMKVKD